MRSKEFVLAVDFDGTIVDHAYPEIGEEVPNAIKWLKYLSARGANIILWTVRQDERLEQAVEYLSDNDIPLYGVNHNPLVPNRKPKILFDYCVDDRNVGTPLQEIDGFKSWVVNWDIVGPAVEQLLCLKKAAH